MSSERTAKAGQEQVSGSRGHSPHRPAGNCLSEESVSPRSWSSQLALWSCPRNNGHDSLLPLPARLRDGGAAWHRRICPAGYVTHGRPRSRDPRGPLALPRRPGRVFQDARSVQISGSPDMTRALPAVRCVWWDSPLPTSMAHNLCSQGCGPTARAFGLSEPGSQRPEQHDSLAQNMAICSS